MKKVLWLIVCLMTIAFTSCSSDEGDKKEEPIVKENLYGVWKMVSPLEYQSASTYFFDLSIRSIQPINTEWDGIVTEIRNGQLSNNKFAFSLYDGNKLRIYDPEKMEYVPGRPYEYIDITYEIIMLDGDNLKLRFYKNDSEFKNTIAATRQHDFDPNIVFELIKVTSYVK